MATSMVLEQAPSVAAPVAASEPQRERPADPQEADTSEVSGPNEPMDVDTRGEEHKVANGSEEASAAPDALHAAHTAVSESVGSSGAKPEPAAITSPVAAEETLVKGATPGNPDGQDAQPADPQDDAEMVSGSPRAPEQVLSRAAESAEETRRRLVERATRRLHIQLEFVENARRKVLDESHPDMSMQLAKLQRERERMEEIAHQRAAQFEHGTSVIFAYECDEANSEFEMQCEKLRQEMLEEIHNEMEIINDQRKGGAASARKTSRNTRSTRVKNGSEHVPFAFDTAQKIKKRAGYVFQPLENKLAQSEVDHDLRELTATFEATKKRRVDIDAASLPMVRYYRSRLLYRDWVFQEGDEVYVMNYAASSEYAAVICGITPAELVVLSEKGKYCRLVLMDLRQGRVVLSTLDGLARDDESTASS